MSGCHRLRRLFLRLLHWVIIVFFAQEIVYAAYMIFVVFAPEGISGPLGERARDIPFELMVTRRLYAIELWIAAVGLGIYLGLTEISPRSLRGRCPFCPPRREHGPIDLTS